MDPADEYTHQSIKKGVARSEIAGRAGYIDMDINDKRIVTFGGDPEPEVTSSDSGFVSDRSDFRMDVDVPQDVEHEVPPYGDSSNETTISGADPDDYLEDYKSYVDRYNAEHDTQADLESARAEAEKFEAAYGDAPSATYETVSAPPASHGKPARDPRYVTKGFLAVCMILTMLVSSLLGAFFGGAFSGNNAGTSDKSSAAEQDEDSKSPLAVSDGTGSEMTISDVIDMNADSVVEILVSGTARNYFGQMQLTEGAGSGVIVREDGYIVTNYHVISGANKVQVTLHNGETYPASIVGGNSDQDIAIIKVNAKGLKAATLGDSSTVSVGDTAVAIGNPLGQLGGTATAGIISALDRTLEIEGRQLTLLQTDAAINGGNSGGGLFNSKGELIGIVDAKSSGVGIEGLAFAIPINAVAEDINDIIENGKISTRPVVGITITDVSEENAPYYQLDTPGVYIAQVTGENAQKAGFQVQDRIISFEGEEIETSQQFIAAVKKHKAGDTVTVVVSRSGQEIEIKTVLEAYTSTEG